MRAPTAFGALGEPAHVAKVVVGGKHADNKTLVSDAEQQRVLEAALIATAGAATVYPARGKWRSPRGEMFDESSMVIEIASSAVDACEVFHRRMRAVAGRAAAIADQQGVLVLTHCADGRTEADIVDRRGGTAMRLSPVQKTAALGHFTARSSRKRRMR